MSGSMTSPFPEMTRILPGSATSSSASRRRRYRSERQSYASSIAARVRLPYFSSLPSKRSNSVKASAVPPAKPATTLSLARRRTLRALAFTTVLPSVTWPSPPMATAPLRRTPTMVVPCGLKPVVSVIETLSLAACPWVSSVVNAGEMLEVKVGVDLRSRDVGVAEQLLHSAQLPARLEQVRGKGVPEQVRVHAHAKSLAPCPPGDAVLHSARPEPLAVAADEERRLSGAREP